MHSLVKRRSTMYIVQYLTTMNKLCTHIVIYESFLLYSISKIIARLEEAEAPCFIKNASGSSKCQMLPVRFRFQLLSSKCVRFRFHKNLTAFTASASAPHHWLHTNITECYSIRHPDTVELANWWYKFSPYKCNTCLKVTIFSKLWFWSQHLKNQSKLNRPGKTVRFSIGSQAGSPNSEAITASNIKNIKF